MSTYAAGPSRQSAVVTTVLGIHVVLFLAIASGLGPDILRVVAPGPAPVRLILKEKPKPVLVAPGPTDPEDFEVMRVPRPVIEFPSAEPPPAAPSAKPGNDQAVAGGAAIAPAGSYEPPAVRTQDSRLAALIDSCYPAASRRRGEEGRVLVDLTIAASGRASAWRVAESSGFPGLDAAAGCVIGKIAFVAGRQDGRAVKAGARLPIVFRLN